jgi:hypothetical protein
VHVPPTQLCVGAHATPQPPQLATLVETSTQTVPQSCAADAGHSHAPFTQLCSVWHVTPQPPQLCASVPVSTHVPPQYLVPAGHVQDPPEQLVPPWHCVPHEPQLLLSVAKDVQSVPHALGLLGSEQAQAPLTQVWPIAQLFPQPPQLSKLFCVSTQALPHAVMPCAAHSQCPDVHRWSLPQTTPHAPQLFGSLTETETPLQVWHASTTPLQSLSTPSRHAWLGSRLHAQMGCDRSSGVRHRQLIAPGQSWSDSHDRVQTPPDESTRTHRSDAQSSVSEHDCPNSPGPGEGE